MAPLRQGQIALADVPGAQHNPRPVVVIRPPSGNGPNDAVFVAGISSLAGNPPPPYHVLLPYHPQGHPRTGLTKRCVAKCDWVFTVEQRHVVDVKGFVPTTYMKTILEQLALLGHSP